MIFVTVGTHEQPFNRLVKAIDELKLKGEITESVFIQTGYSTYIPKACEYKKFISMNQMDNYMQQADVIITHGGPSSFIMALQHNKIPIVVPRLSKYAEHINDHQLIFCNELLLRNFPIKVVVSIDNLANEFKGINSDRHDKKISLHNGKFIKSFEEIVHDMYKDRRKSIN